MIRWLLLLLLFKCFFGLLLEFPTQCGDEMVFGYTVFVHIGTMLVEDVAFLVALVYKGEIHIVELAAESQTGGELVHASVFALFHKRIGGVGIARTQGQRGEVQLSAHFEGVYALVEVADVVVLFAEGIGVGAQPHGLVIGVFISEIDETEGPEHERHITQYVVGGD